MSLYRDMNVRIDKKDLRIKGLLMPKISDLRLDIEEVIEVRSFELSTVQKFHIIGSINMKTWWCWDTYRPFKKKAFIAKFNDKVGPFEEVAFTVDDHSDASDVFEEVLGDRFIKQ
mgnify:CR=1 FL=1